MRSTALVTALLLLVACGPKPPPTPPPKDPPQVFVTFPSSNVVGTQIEVNVSVVGCGAVKELSLYHTTPEGSEQLVLSNLAYTTTPTTFAIASEKIPYTLTGLSANLSLKAKALCDDDRKNTSSSVSAIFFPVEQVIEKGGGLVVPEVFVADGQGSNALFFGCSGAAAGLTQLVRVNAAGDVTQTQPQVPYPCSLNSSITHKNIASGKRWIWEAGLGGYSFDANLNITSQTAEQIHALGVMPNGDAITWNSKALMGSLKWVQHSNGQVKWQTDPLGAVAGPPIQRTGFGVYVPEFFFDQGTLEATFRIQSFNETTGAPTNTYDITKWQYQTGDAPFAPQSAFNNDGSLVYFPVTLPGFATSQVWACASTGTGCTGGNSRWKTVVLPGVVSAIIPFHNGAKLAAVASNVTWFLDASTGAVLNKEGIGITPEGRLVTVGIEVNRLGTDVYLLNAAPCIDGFPCRPAPVEIVAVDSPDKGEVFRYQLDSGSISAAIDDSGKLWLRIGNNLIRPKSLGDYRAARGN